MPAKLTPGHAADRIEVASPSRDLPRRGIIAEVVGAHERYRVRRLDGSESIHYPSDGTDIRPAGARRRR